MTIIAMCEPEHIADLLAYSSIIIKASLDYDDLPWLEYDAHFRRQAATWPKGPWAQLDAALWMIYFTQARAKAEDDTHKSADTGGKPSKATEKPRLAPYTTVPICKKWNSPDGCNLPLCRYQHYSTRCSSSLHKSILCPLNQKHDASRAPPIWPNTARR